MKKFLLASTVLLATTMAGNAVFIDPLGLDPNTGFGRAAGTGAFEDFYTFTLDKTATLTIAGAINNFSDPTQFIANFQGSVFAGSPPPSGPPAFGPELAGACAVNPTGCQSFSGSAVLGPGTYFLDISGTDASATSSYGGTLNTLAVPGPIVGAGIPGLITGALALFGFGWKQRRRSAVA